MNVRNVIVKFITTHADILGEPIYALSMGLFNSSRITAIDLILHRAFNKIVVKF